MQDCLLVKREKKKDEDNPGMHCIWNLFSLVSLCLGDEGSPRFGDGTLCTEKEPATQ